MKKVSGWKFLVLALIAFTGLGLEVFLALCIEQPLFGAPIREWFTWQSILHWILTFLIWGIIGYALVSFAKKKYAFDLFAQYNVSDNTKVKMKAWQWIAVIVIVMFSLFISYRDWNGSKVVQEFIYNGWLKFIFQYIYYIFETMLFILILIFSQNAFDLWFHKPYIPFGGLIVAITWGAAHFVTKDFITGIVCMLSGILFGSVYLLLNRDIRKAFPILLIMFVL